MVSPLARVSVTPSALRSTCSARSGWKRVRFSACSAVFARATRRSRLGNMMPITPSSASGAKSSAPGASPSLTQMRSIGQPLPSRWSATPIADSMAKLVELIADTRPSKSVAVVSTGLAGSITAQRTPWPERAMPRVRPTRPPPNMVTSKRCMTAVLGAPERIGKGVRAPLLPPLARPERASGR